MIEAAAYYEAQKPDHGRRLVASVQDAVNRIRLKPRLYPIVELDVRRCLTKTFDVLFRERPDKIVIMAVMHLHRDPDYWKGR